MAGRSPLTGSSPNPNLFWPRDRAWCVGTEIDFDSTLVAGSHPLIAELTQNPTLECWPIDPNASLTSGSDELN